MEAFKNLIKNIALFLLIGAIPSLGWASGILTPLSWPSAFLFLAGVFCILWIKARNAAQSLRKILLTRGEAWALWEGYQIVERSPTFPSDSFESFQSFVHPNSLSDIERSLRHLIHENVPFQLRIRVAGGDAIYSLEGEPLEGKVVLWLKNITDCVHQEQLQKEILQKNDFLLSQLQATLNLLPLPIWHRDEHQKLTFCNTAYSKAVQASPQRIYEEGIELIQPRFAKILARKATNTGEPQSFESPAIADGNRCRFRICEIPHEQNQGTLGMAIDISELEDIRMEVKRLLNAHDEVLAHLSTAISVYDADGTLHYYNQAYVNLHSFNEDFLKGQPRLDEVLEELRSRRQLPEYADFPAYKKRLLQQLKEQVFPEEALMHLPDERTLRIFSAPHPMGGLLFMFEDVTDYLTLERRHKALFEGYQATIDNLFEGVVVIGSDNRLKIFNPSFVRLWDFKEGEVKLDQHFNQVVEKLKDLLDYEGEWEPYKAQFIESATDRVPKTGQLKRKGGVIVNFRYVPLPNGDHLLSYTDATDTYRIQRMLQEKNEAFGTADRLKSEFIANVSSELKSPLTTIIGFTEILSHQYFGKLNEQQIDYVNGVLDSSTKLLNLVNDILDLVSIEAGSLNLQPKSVDIRALLKDVMEVMADRAKAKRQNLALKCDKSVSKWTLDEERLKQALLNLTSNAINVTPAEGKITLSAKVVKDELQLAGIRGRGSLLRSKRGSLES